MKRLLESELMDDPNLDSHRHRKALQGLDRINRVSGTEGVIWRHIRNLLGDEPSTISLLDIASGSGEIPINQAIRARSGGHHIELTCCDFSQLARTIALENCDLANVQMRYESLDVTSGALATLGCFDVVMCNLFFHHLHDESAIDVLRQSSRMANRLLIVNDIRRDWMNLMLANIVPQILTRSDVVHVDAVRSVRAAYSVEEFRSLAVSAGLHSAEVRKIFPRRMVLTWSPQ
tara:strand:+ start:1936 stop:2634 length:699 start_codon:yes stop_codon:yes gene_type:complete